MLKCYNFFTMIKKVVGIYLSSMEESIEIIEGVAEEIANKLNEECVCEIEREYYDFGDILTNDGATFDTETVVVLGVPVVAGKIPMACLKLLKMLDGGNAMTVAVATYAGASYGRALQDLYSFAEMRGFKVVSAGAFVARHVKNSIFKKVMENRPDARDFEQMSTFGKISGRKIRRLGGCEVELLQVKPAPLNIGCCSKNAIIGRVKRKDPEWFL